MGKFKYYEEICEKIEEESGYLIIKISSKISEIDQLFDEYNIQAKFPYFGKNWDALYDCLTDFSWLDSNCILIIHSDIPLSGDAKAMQIYLKLLIDVIESWRGDEKRVEVLFPIECQNQLRQI